MASSYFIEMYRASSYLQRSADRYILCGKNRDKLIALYKSDFEFVYGSRAEEYINALPHDDGEEHFIDDSVMLVRDLILADMKKMSYHTLSIGIKYNAEDKLLAETAARYAYCINKHLQEAGSENITFVLPHHKNPKYHLRYLRPIFTCHHGDFDGCKELYELL